MSEHEGRGVMSTPEEVARVILGCKPATWSARGHLWWKTPEREVCQMHSQHDWPCPWAGRAANLIAKHDADVAAQVLNQRASTEGDLYDPEELPQGLFRTAARVVSEMGGHDRDCTNELHRDVMQQDPCQMCAFYRAARLIHAYSTDLVLAYMKRES